MEFAIVRGEVWTEEDERLNVEMPYDRVAQSVEQRTSKISLSSRETNRNRSLTREEAEPR
jgi:hypothetical protein